MRNGWIAVGALLALAGCGGSPEASGNGAAADAAAGSGATATAASGGMPADFKATDACAVIDKAAVGTALGVTVTEASLGLVHEPSGGADAATSECTYLFDGGRATVMTRWSPIGDTSDDTITQARNTTNATLKPFGGGTVEDVPGVGRASLWVEKIGQLQTFIGKDRMIMITVPSGTGAKDKAVALAHKAGG